MFTKNCLIMIQTVDEDYSETIPKNSRHNLNAIRLFRGRLTAGNSLFGLYLNLSLVVEYPWFIHEFASVVSVLGHQDPTLITLQVSSAFLEAFVPFINSWLRYGLLNSLNTFRTYFSFLRLLIVWYLHILFPFPRFTLSIWYLAAKAISWFMGSASSSSRLE